MISDLCRNGRHLAITVLITSQYATDLGPGLRSQVDCVFVLRDPSIQNRKRLWSSYFGLMPLAQFNAVFDAATEAYGALVLNQTVPSNEVRECVFWYRAKPAMPPFRLTNEVYYKLATRSAPNWARGLDTHVEICGRSTVSSTNDREARQA